MASTEELRKYLHYVDDLDLSEPQKIEFLQTLWSMMSQFVDLGFGTSSAQQISPPVRVKVDGDPRWLNSAERDGDNNTDLARSGSS
jgi:hypothetical protein